MKNRKLFHLRVNSLTPKAIFILACAIFITCVSPVWSQTSPQLGIRDKTPDGRAFINARIVVSPDETIEKGTLLIKDGLVYGVGENISIPDRFFVIDVKGKTIYPGLFDIYTEYGLSKPEKSGRGRNRAPQYTGKRVGGNAWNDAIHSEVMWSRHFQPNDKDSKKLLKLGFTTVQSIRKDGIFRGRSFVALLGAGLPNDLILDPNGRHFISFKKGTSKQDYPESMMGAIALIRQMFYDVDWYQKAHKAYQKNKNQKLPEFNAAIEGLANYGSKSMIFDGGTDVHSISRIERISEEFKVSFISLASGYEYARIADVKKSGQALIVSLDFPKAPTVKTLEDDYDLKLSQLRHWETAPSNPARLEENGIKFALSTSRLKEAKGFWKNLRTAIKRGLSKKRALAALTTVPAKLCDLSHRTGTLEKGKFANFFICDGDIFEEEVDIYSTWVAGKKNDFKAIPEEIFEGEYSFKIGETTYSLNLTGITPSVKGSLKIDEWKSKLKNVETDHNKISFAAKIDSTEDAGLYRFTGRKEDNAIVGQVTDPVGNLTDWTATYVGPVAEEPKEDEDKEEKNDEQKEGDVPEAFFARLTYPNKAYGFETLPVTENLLIQNGTIWTADEAGTLENADLLIIDGKVAGVGQNLVAPPEVKTIDATGKHITPGIIDAHSHLAGTGGLNEGTFAITPEVRVADVINPDQINIYRQVAGGVTGCLSMHGSANPIGGQCQTIKLRWGSSAEEMKFEDAPIMIKFALGENVKQSNWGERYNTRYPQSRMGVETIMRDEFQAAREYESDWLAYNKLGKRNKTRTIPPRKNIRLDAIVEVLHNRMMVQCHAYTQAEILMMMRLAEEFGFTLDLFGHILEGYKVADEMAKHGAGGTTFSDWWAYKFEVYDAIPYNAGLMADRGVLTTVNSDNADLARRLNTEAAKIVMYNGMPQDEAIKLVTINSARQLGIDDRVGSLTVGKDADFVIWNGNPLSLHSRVEETWIDGKNYFSIEKDAAMQQEIKEEKYLLIQKLLQDSGSDENSKSDKRGKK